MQISDNEIYLLIKYIKSVLWRVAKCLSYTEEARCLKIKEGSSECNRRTDMVEDMVLCHALVNGVIKLQIAETTGYFLKYCETVNLSVRTMCQEFSL